MVGGSDLGRRGGRRRLRHSAAGRRSMGTLSGGGKEILSIGKRCLLRRECASVFRSATTAWSRRLLCDRGHQSPPRRRTGGQSARAFRRVRAAVLRNSQTGAIEARNLRCGYRFECGPARELTRLFWCDLRVLISAPTVQPGHWRQRRRDRPYDRRHSKVISRGRF